MRWLKQILSRRRRYRELAESIREHLEEKIEDLMQDGLSREEATHIARREFGNVTLIEERSREVWQWPRIETFLQDLRFGVRMLLKKPGFTVIAVITLALGIGANTAIFSAVDALLLRQLPFPDPERLVMIWENDTEEGNSRNPVAPANFVDWRKQNEVCSQIGYFTQPGGVNITGRGEPERITGVFVSQNLFSLLGAQPQIGRGFIDEDLKERQGLVVLLSHGLWRRRFGGDPSVIGKSLTLDGAPYTVIGVMPPQFQLPEEAELWGMTFNGELATMRGQHFLRVMARLKPGVTIERARANFSLIARQLEQQYPATNKGYGVSMISLREQLT